MRYGVLLAGVFGLLAAPALVGVGLNVPRLFHLLPAVVKRSSSVSAEDAADAARSSGGWRNCRSKKRRRSGATVGSLLLIVWGFVAVLGLFRLVLGLWKQRRTILGHPWSAVWWTEQRAACLAEKVSLRRFPAVFCSPNAPMPMVVGLLRPKIVLPETAPESWGQPQWEAVLLHEAAHIARRDPWAALAQCLAVILFWWCPLVHLMARQLNDLREAICDDYALEGPCDRLAYAEVLVDSAERLVNLRALPVPVGLIDSARGGLEERITRLLAKEKEPMKKLSFAGKLLGASLLAAACLSITAATALSQTPPAKKIQIKIIVDGTEIDLDGGSLAALLQVVQSKPEAAPKPGDTIHFKLYQTTPAKAPQGEWQIAERVQVTQAKPDATPKTIDLPRIDVNAFSPDGKVLINTDGRIVTVIDGKTGKVVAKVDLGEKPGEHARVTQGLKAIRAIAQPVQAPTPAKPDPRIEELVRAAEAIKPGSGAAVRQALQGNSAVAKQSDKDKKASVLRTQDKDYIEIHTDDGKVLRLKIAMSADPAATDRDKKAAEDALRHAEAQKAIAEVYRLQALEALKALGAPKKAPAAPVPPTKPAGSGAGIEMRFETKPGDPKAKEQIERALEFLKKATHDSATKPVAPVGPVSPPAKSLPARNPSLLPGAVAPPGPGPDVEALARQIERLTRELHELRDRLEQNKKQQR